MDRTMVNYPIFLNSFLTGKIQIKSNFLVISMISVYNSLIFKQSNINAYIFSLRGAWDKVLIEENMNVSMTSADCLH